MAVASPQKLIYPLYRFILPLLHPRKKTAAQEAADKRKYRARREREKLTGRKPAPKRGSHARDAEQEFGLTAVDFAALRQPFRKRLNEARRKYTLDGRLRARPLPTQHQYSSQPKLPRGSTFPEAGKLLVFCLRYWCGGLSQPALARRYGMSQPQANRWLKYAHPLLLATLQALAADPTETARALAACWLPSITAPVPPAPAAAG